MTSQSVWKGPTTTACSSTWTSTTTSIQHRHHLCGDLQHNKIHHWIQIDITSTAKSLACSSGHHWYVQTSNSQRKDHTRHLASPSEWDWSHLKHTLRYIKGTLHYKFLISPRLPQGHSLPLRQLIPLHINTYCDSDCATDIESRKSTSGTVTSALGVPLALNSRT